MPDPTSQNALIAKIQTLPAIGQGFLNLYDSLWTLPSLPASTLECCRRRLAQLRHCDPDWLPSHYELEADKAGALSRWPSSPVFDDAERACLEFAEIHAMDAASITDAQAAAVKLHYGDAGLVALIEALGIIDGMLRLGCIWGIEQTASEASL